MAENEVKNPKAEQLLAAFRPDSKAMQALAKCIADLGPQTSLADFSFRLNRLQNAWSELAQCTTRLEKGPGDPAVLASLVKHIRQQEELYGPVRQIYVSGYNSRPRLSIGCQSGGFEMDWRDEWTGDQGIMLAELRLLLGLPTGA